MPNLVNVVIPTKSNFTGLAELLSDLSLDPAVGTICIVADGQAAFDALPDPPDHIIKIVVPDGIGIQHMWNRGIEAVGRESHIAFLNDDVRLSADCLSSLANSLDNDPTIGIICPNYSSVEMEEDRQVFNTCGSRYDGTGGLAGFAMMLRSDLAKVYSFDEKLTWWYGDDDVLLWVTRTMGMYAVISHAARCQHADSVTIRTNPPADFGQLVANDREYFRAKWL
jgi:GT2 family glycosyltransferase